MKLPELGQLLNLRNSLFHLIGRLESMRITSNGKLMAGRRASERDDFTVLVLR